MKREYTLGEIARALNVARSTVIAWIREGLLKGYKLPGGNNRVPRENLVAFMRRYGMPLDFLDGFSLKRVLVLDTDEKTVKTVKAVLKKDPDIRVLTVKDAFEAGVVVREQRPHVILLDPEYPGMDVKAAAKLLNDYEELKDIKIVAVVTKVKPEVEKELKKSVAEVMKKPVDKEVLLSTVRRLVF